VFRDFRKIKIHTRTFGKNTYRYFGNFQDTPKKIFLGGLRPPILSKTPKITLYDFHATSHTGYFCQACLSRRPQAGKKNFFRFFGKNTKKKSTFVFFIHVFWKFWKSVQRFWKIHKYTNTQNTYTDFQIDPHPKLEEGRPSASPITSPPNPYF
jgi:hypothetical protein